MHKEPSFDLLSMGPPLHHSMPIKVAGLPPEQPALIEAITRDQRDIPWTARAHYNTSKTGTIDTSVAPSLSGSYVGLDPDGLLWSAQPPGMDDYLAGLHGDPQLPLSPGPFDCDDLVVDLAVRIEGHVLCRHQLRRPQIAANVAVTKALPDPLRGELFEPENVAAKGTVLVLGGSEGGIVASRAAALAAEGYCALALGYFAYADRPQAAINLPLEYFAQAVAMLHQRTGKNVVIWGGSRGSEAAMLTAIHFPKHIAGVIAWVPSHLVNCGFDMLGGEDFSISTTAMWALDDHSIKGAPMLPVSDDLLSARGAGYSAPPGYAYSPEFEAIWQAAGQDSDYTICVEKLAGELCIISAQDDQLWPSALGGDILFKRRKHHGLAARTRHICLANAGHAIGMPNMARPYSHLTYWSGGYSGVPEGFVSLGGTPVDNAAAARDGWAAAIDFLRDVFDD